jgi:hypothetical protein
MDLRQLGKIHIPASAALQSISASKIHIKSSAMASRVTGVAAARNKALRVILVWLSAHQKVWITFWTSGG